MFKLEPPHGAVRAEAVRECRLECRQTREDLRIAVGVEELGALGGRQRLMAVEHLKGRREEGEEILSGIAQRRALPVDQADALRSDDEVASAGIRVEEDAVR